jgi:cytochrome oxidase Cu insertion factor (SCO1/SenC/PrrC family)
MKEDTTENTSSTVRLARWKVLLLAAMFVAPVLVAYSLYLSGWRSERTVNFGELVHPARPLTDEPLLTLDGQKHSLASLRGKWQLVYLGPSECLKPCTDNLYKMQQVVLALGKDRIRLTRVFIVTDTGALEPLRQTIKNFPDTIVLKGEPDAIARLARQFTVNGGSPLDNRHRVYIVDPLGNLMMSYPADADPSGMRKDLVRLLKVSRIG